MLIVTGGAGFIGSALVWQLNQMGREDILIVDHLGHNEKWKNLRALKFMDYIEKDNFFTELYNSESYNYDTEAVFHIGACSSTTELDGSYLIDNNFAFSKNLSLYCFTNDIPFIYASSAATYGDGSLGFLDNEEQIDKLRPLNMYGYSKQMFDLWARRKGLLKKQVGLKFFNVYGPNEAHKGEMRSVVHKAFGQIKAEGKIRLFKSYHEKYSDGGQMRDFVYVKDVVRIIIYFWQHPELAGLFNVGQGQARSWNDLAHAIFSAMGKKPEIDYIEMPMELRGKYQYFTEAEMGKLRKSGYRESMTSLEDGIADYVRHYLQLDIFLGD